MRNMHAPRKKNWIRKTVIFVPSSQFHKHETNDKREVVTIDFVCAKKP